MDWKARNRIYSSVLIRACWGKLTRALLSLDHRSSAFFPPMSLVFSSLELAGPALLFLYLSIKAWTFVQAPKLVCNLPNSVSKLNVSSASHPLRVPNLMVPVIFDSPSSASRRSYPPSCDGRAYRGTDRNNLSIEYVFLIVRALSDLELKLWDRPLESHWGWGWGTRSGIDGRERGWVGFE